MLLVKYILKIKIYLSNTNNKGIFILKSKGKTHMFLIGVFLI